MAAFSWGEGGAQMTPEAIAAQRKVAEALMSQGMDYSPVRSPWQGAARVAQAMLGGLKGYDADQADKANLKFNEDLQNRFLQQANGGTPAAAAPGQPLDLSPPSPGPQAPSAPPDVVAGDPSLPRGIRNNNPLNIEAGGFTQGQPGFSGSDGRFAKFETPQAGVDAAGKLLDVYRDKHGLNTPLGIVSRWAPSSDGNNTDAYAKVVAAKLGIGPNDPISPEMRPALIAAMGQHENGRPIPNANVAAAAANPPVQLAQAAVPAGAPPAAVAAPAPAAPVAAANGLQGVNPALIQALTSPYSSEGTKKIAGLLLQQKLGEKVTYQTTPDGDVLAMDPRGVSPPKVVYKAAAKPIPIAEGGSLYDPATKTVVAGTGDKETNEQKNYKAYAAAERAAGRSPAIFGDWEEKMKKAGAQGVYFQGETEFSKKSGELQAKRFDELAGDGQAAKQMISDINTLSDLGKNIGTGKEAEIKAALGPYAEAFGIKIDKLSDIQAFEAVVNRVGPQLRVKGSGAQSDYELKNFLKSLPTLGNTPEGNAISSEVMKGLYENKIKAAEIGSRALNGEISRPDAEKQLRELPDPMENYRAFMKKNRGAPTASGPAAPTVDDLVKKYSK